MKIIILIPIYNDWQSATKLLENINNEVSGIDHTFSIILVNDASTEQITENLSNFSNLNSVQILNLKQNVGHSRCIATGLNHHPNKTIVGERVKRSESILFKLCYSFLKILTYTFTGQSIKFGNYTCLTKSTIEKMLSDKATWSSFSGSLAKNCNNRATIASERGKRYFGPSKMSFLNLIKHSLAIIGVFKFNVLIRSILFILVYFFLIHQKTSFIMFIPLILVVIFLISIFVISKRENLNEIENSLENIFNIQKF